MEPPELGCGPGYNPYLFVLIGQDAEWTRRQQAKTCSEAVRRVVHEFRDHAAQYRADLERRLRTYPEESQSDEFDAQLFKPISYIPIGHADALSLVLFDDFDPLHSLTANSSTAIEEICIAFCPRMDGIKASLVESPATEGDPDLSAWDSILVEPAQIFALLEAERPLLFFSRFKLVGWGALGFALLFQTALQRIMAQSIRQTMARLFRECEQGKLSDFGISTSDLRQVRIAFLELQGQEEIGIVITANNFTIPAALLARLEAITIGEVFAADAFGRLRDLVNQSVWFQSIQRFYEDIAPNDDELPAFPGVETIEHSHALRWVRSTVAVGCEVFEQDVPPLKGAIHAVTQIQCATGHQGESERHFQHLREKLGTAAEPDAEAPLPNGPFRLLMIGQGDLLLHQASFRRRPGAERLGVEGPTWVDRMAGFSLTGPELLVPTARFIWQARRSMDYMVRDAQPQLRRDVVGLASYAAIPVPVLFAGKPERADGEPEDFLAPSIHGNHASILETILPVLRHRIAPHFNPAFVPTDDDPPSKRDAFRAEEMAKRIKDQHCLNESTSGGLCLGAIVNRTRTYRLPLSLRRTLQYLYQNFATIIANPFIFDTILDLYDVFATLHGVLTRALVAQEVGTAENRFAIPNIHEKKTEQIARMIGAMHRALDHRLYRAFPEDTHRDMDIDFRGGLNQLILSVDTVLKCGVGVLRNNVLQASNARDRVGVVQRVDFEPGIVATRLNLGIENQGRLAFIRTDVPHIYHVASYVDFLHEAFHLLYDEIRGPAHLASEGRCFLPTIASDTRIDHLLGEIFVNLLTALFIAPDDPDLLVRHFFIQYATSARGVSKKDEETVVGIVSRSFTLFCVRDCLCLARDFYVAQGQADYWQEISEGSLPAELREFLVGTPPVDRSVEGPMSAYGDSAARRFQKCLETFGPLLPRYAHFFVEKEQGTGAQRYADNYFREWHPKVQLFLPILLRKVCDIFTDYRARVPGNARSARPGTFPVTADLRACERRARRELSEARRPLAWALSQPDPSAAAMDPMVLVCLGIRAILESRSKNFEDRSADDFIFHLPLENDNFTSLGTPKLEPLPEGDRRRYAEFLIRPGQSSFFCSIPQRRRERLLLQITVIKTCWDISSHLRAKRLAEMLGNNLSVPSKPDQSS